METRNLVIYHTARAESEMGTGVEFIGSDKALLNAVLEMFKAFIVMESDESRAKCIYALELLCDQMCITMVHDDEAEWYDICSNAGYCALRIDESVTIVEEPFITWKGRW